MNKSTGKTAKTCYEHIGGKLGQLLLEQFVEKGWIAKENLQTVTIILQKKDRKNLQNWVLICHK
jgi:hypothetical protein